MKMSKSRKNLDLNVYYRQWTELDLKPELHQDRQICRVCMKGASIPIHLNENSIIADALKIFGSIVVNENDGFPKHLCETCYQFLKSAILFRKIAKKTDQLLKTPIKEEKVDQSPDNNNYAEDTDSEKGLKSLPITETLDEKIKNLKANFKIQCYVCNKIVNKSYYKQHLTLHDPNHCKYLCDICGKSFRLRCAYHNHSLRHGNGFPFKCQFCPYKGKYAELLKTHMRAHIGEYRYMCTECPARFLFKSNLNSHILNKHKEREHKCDTCKRAFHTKLSLQRHIEVDHLGLKMHACNICDNTFGYRNAMMKHQRRVHKREKMTFSRMPSYLQAESKNEARES